MSKCIVCGRSLVTEQSAWLGIGPECFRKSKKSGVTGRRVTAWKRRVQRTTGLARGSFEIGDTQYTRIDDCFPVMWNDGKHLIDFISLKSWLEKNKQIVLPEEVTETVYEALCSGITVEEIVAQALDKSDIV